METYDGERRHAGGADKEIGLMVALLVRFPEIGTVRVAPSDATLHLSFMLKREPDEAELRSFERGLKLGLGALFRLGGAKASQLHIDVHRHGEIAVLEVVRDIETLSVEEFPVLLGIINDVFGNLLIVDEEGDVVAGEDDALELADTLDDLRGAACDRTLIGFRDGGRVLVFNEV